ncbi:MAG TPA: PRC-barrel domain-containing protein [Parafilimonas sp.]|nr:PRC-barrel domain-containing protein [Parafilimonas sp.]
MATRNIRYSKLVELGNSGYEIVPDEPDIRNWRVTNRDGKLLGVIDELLVDRQLNKVRYIVLNLQGKPLNLLSRKVLIPIGIAQLDRIDDIVILPAITLEHLATLPTYKKGKLSFETERKIRNIFAPSNAVEYDDTVTDDAFYDDDYFNDRNFYDSRKKKLSRDNVVLNDNDVRSANNEETGKFAPFREGAMEITEQSEIPVVKKEARVVEEVSVNKDVTERDEKVKDSVRNTEINVEPLDNNT